jgi:polar amino acid transport system permease protein
VTRIVPLRRPGLWLSSVVVIALLAWLAVAVWRNPNVVHRVGAEV